MHNSRLPWDTGQFRRSDLGFFAGAVIICIAIPLVTVPIKPKAVILPERTILLPPVVELPEPVKPQPKPEPKPEPEPTPEPEAKPKPKPEPKPVAVTPPPAKPAPPAPKPVTPTQSGSPDKPAVKTERPAKAMTTVAPVAKPAATPNPKPVPVETPTPVTVKPGPTAAELREAAQRRAQAAVQDTGLGSAIGSLTSGSSKAKPVEGRGLQKGGVEGGKADVKLNTAASTSKASKVDFGSATSGDKNAKVSDKLSDRKTTEVSGEIKDSATAGKSTAKSSGNGNGKGKRGDIERIMSQAKGRLQSAYKRALDEDPTMQGSVTVKLRIAADGKVLSAVIVSSDLNNSALESKMLSLIKGLTFDDGEYDVWEDTYKFNFIPQ
jgi:protein TonB